MITIPIGLNKAGLPRLPFTSYVLLVIFEDDNLDRMKQHDPGELPISKMPEPWRSLPLDLIQFIYASPDEVKMLTTLARDQVQDYIKKTLYRGWKFRPEKGDNDAGPQRPKEN